MASKQTQEKLDEIERVTLSHYNSRAESFWQGTRDHDVSQNVDAFLAAIGNARSKSTEAMSNRLSAFDVLDFGCGPGRDLLTFKDKGHKPTGLDGSKEFCEMAHEYSKCPVLHQQFLNIDLPLSSYDGIYANASMFHVPSQELHSVLSKCNQALKPGGILFTSNPRGSGEGWQGERYGNYMEYEQSKACLEQAGFSIVHHYYRPEGLPRDEQSWLAIVSQKLNDI